MTPKSGTPLRGPKTCDAERAIVETCLLASQFPRRVSICDELRQEIIGYVRERLAHFEAPRSVDFVEQLPRTETGKLLKCELQQARS